MKHLAIAALALLALPACVDQKARDAANEARCARYGAPPGSPGFTDCMVGLARLDALEGHMQAQRMQAAGAALTAAGAALRTPDPVNTLCTSSPNGPNVITTCHSQ